MSDLPGVITSLGAVRAHTARVAEEVTRRWDLTFVWGIGATGEHHEGRALDFMGYDGGTVTQPGPMRPEVCEAIAGYLWANRARLGVWYVIWQRRIISVTYPWHGWRDYDGDNPHTDHVHVSFLEDPPAYRPPAITAPPEEDDMTPEQASDLKALAADASRNEERYRDTMKAIQTWGKRNQTAVEALAARVAKLEKGA